MNRKDTAFYSLLMASAALGLVLLLGTSTNSIQAFIGQLLSIGSITNSAVIALASSQLFFSRSNFALSISSMTWQTGLAVFLTIGAAMQALVFQSSPAANTMEWLGLTLIYKITPLLYFCFWWLSVRGKAMKFHKTLLILTAAIALVLLWHLIGGLFAIYPVSFLNAGQYGYLATSISSVLLLIGLWFISTFYWALARFTVPLYV